LIDSGKVLLFAGDAQIGNWLSWQDVPWKDQSINTDDLLARTVFYKVGHHASHNATLVAGLEKMTSPELVALIPVHKQDPKHHQEERLANARYQSLQQADGEDAQSRPPDGRGESTRLRPEKEPRKGSLEQARHQTENHADRDQGHDRQIAQARTFSEVPQAVRSASNALLSQSARGSEHALASLASPQGRRPLLTISLHEFTQLPPLLTERAAGGFTNGNRRDLRRKA
jgi:hypothetical protein